MRENGYHWWINRIKATLSQVDMMRIDHFRGFEAYWEVPAEEETAEAAARQVEGAGIVARRPAGLIRGEGG